MADPLRPKIEVTLVFLLAVLTSGLYLLSAPDSLLNKPCGDCEGGYLAFVNNFLDGKGWVGVDGTFNAIRPPGHSLFLIPLVWISKIYGLSTTTVFLVSNTLLNGISAVLLLIMARQYYSHWTRIVVPITWISCPFILWFLNQPYPELPFFVAFYSFIYCWIKLTRCCYQSITLALVCGITFGVATMIRPSTLGLAGVFLVLSFWDQKHLLRSSAGLAKNMLAFALGLALMTVPWSVVVYQKTGSVIYVTDGKLSVNGLLNGMFFGIDELENKASIKLPDNVQKFLVKLDKVVEVSDDSDALQQYGINRTYDMNKFTDVGKLLGRMLVQHPIAAVQLVYIKITRPWYGTYSNRWSVQAGSLMLGYLLACIMGIVTSFILRTELLKIGVLGLVVIGYFWAIASIFEPLVRYLTPTLGLMFLLVPQIWCRSTPKEKTGIPHTTG